MKTAEFGDRLKQLRKENNLTQTDVANYLNKVKPDFKSKEESGKGVISRWENKKSKPKHAEVGKILADYFGVSENYIWGYSDSREDDEDCKFIPVVGSIVAGMPIEAVENKIEDECVKPGENVDFCLKVKGDSMVNARIYEGDTVFVRKQKAVENGEIAVVKVDDGEATLKRFYKVNGTVFLKPENPAYEEIIIHKKDNRHVEVIGKAIYFKSEVR